MRIILKLIISVLLLPMIGAGSVIAQSAFLQMPLDIKLGVTKNTEIANKGICLAKAPDSSNRCVKYSMMGDSFFAYPDADGVIVKISFLAVDHHVLPQNWQSLGLRLASSYRYRKIRSANETNDKTLENEGGNLQADFLDIVKRNKAENIQQKTTYTSDFQIGEAIIFTLGNYQYHAEFIKWVKPRWCADCPLYTDYNNGLVSIEVTKRNDL